MAKIVLVISDIVGLIIQHSYQYCSGNRKVVYWFFFFLLFCFHFFSYIYI
jgi:hypothetical protein